MSHTYKPGPTGNVVIDHELESLQRSLNGGQTERYWVPLAAEPAKKKAGMQVYADGVNWNPGSGEGLYRYSIAGAWVFVG